MTYYQQQQTYINGNGKLVTTAVFVSNQKRKIICYGVQYCCQTNSCLYQSLVTHLSIYILHTLSTLSTYMMYSLLYNYLPFTCTSLIILHKTYSNIHDNTFVSTLRLIFTSKSHIIMLGYDSQETLFYLKAKLTFIDESTDLRD